MTWHFSTLGSHVHVRVLMNGALCGKLCFRVEEFELIQKQLAYSNQYTITFVDDDLELDKARHRSDDDDFNQSPWKNPDGH